MPDLTAVSDTADTLHQLHRKILKRLAPLYAAAFLQGFVLWYAIEKLFMRSIGFDDAGIGLAIALYSAVMLLVETPSGILADRWSRKGVLILASVSLTASSIVAGISNSEFLFLLSSALWGVYFALYSGTYDSIIYDTIAEESGDSKSFDRYYGHIRFLDSAALVISSLIGGLLASAADLRTPFFATIFFTAISVIALLRFKEPRLHKADAAEPIFNQISQTFRAVLQNRVVLPILSVAVLLAVMLDMILEFSQVWLLALNTPAALYGVANGVLLAGLGLGGLLAGYRQMSQNRLFILAMVGFTLCGIGLSLSRNTALIIACQTIFCTLIVAASVVITRLLHDQLPSKIRAGASSAVSTIGRIIIIPLALLFGYISREASIFESAWLLVGFAIIASIVMLRYFVYATPFRLSNQNDDLPNISPKG